MTMTRGFSGRRHAQPEGNRVPPGQSVTDEFPVISAGRTPRTPLKKWTLALQEGGSLAGRWTWEKFQFLPQTEITVDIHCVTEWSKLGTKWKGVTIDHLIKVAGRDEPPAPYLMAYCDGDYTTNLPVEDPIGGNTSWPKNASTRRLAGILAADDVVGYSALMEADA